MSKNFWKCMPCCTIGAMRRIRGRIIIKIVTFSALLVVAVIVYVVFGDYRSLNEERDSTYRSLNEGDSTRSRACGMYVTTSPYLHFLSLFVAQTG